MLIPHTGVRRATPKVVVFDFDDTLFPTSAIKGQYYATDRFQDEMQAMGYLVNQMMMSLLREGAKLYIVTLSGEQWVQEQCDTYFPFLRRHIREGLVTLKARWNDYRKLVVQEEMSHARAAIQTKTDAMSEIVLENPTCTRFYTVGDSTHDHVSMEVALDEVHQEEGEKMVVRHFKTVISPRLTIPFLGMCLLEAWKVVSDSVPEVLEPIKNVLEKGIRLCPKDCDLWKQKLDSFVAIGLSGA